MDFTQFDRLISLTPASASPNEAIATTLDGRKVTLSVASFGEGVVRVRMNASAKPDYGLLLAHADDTVATTDGSSLSIAAGRAALTLSSDATHPVGLALNWRGKPLLTSLTDEHFRGMAKPLEATRIAPFGIAVGMTVAAFALASDTPVYGLGEKGGALNKRGQLVSSRVEDALGVNTDLSYKNTPFAWAITPHGCWGVLTPTTVDVMHGVGYAQWSNRSYAVVSNESGLDLFFIAADTPVGVLAAYHRLTGKPENVPLWSLGAWVSRAYYRDEADIMATANEVRERRFPADVITFDGRAWQDTPTRFHFNFDPSRYPDPKRVIDQLKALDYKICCWEYPLV